MSIAISTIMGMEVGAEWLPPPDEFEDDELHGLLIIHLFIIRIAVAFYK